MENKRRLLKDLPFGNLNAGMVVIKGSLGEYYVNMGTTFYSGGGSADRGLMTFDGSANSILDEIWNNEKWFESVELKDVQVVVNHDRIIFQFKSIDIGDAEDLAKGLIHILPHLGEGSYVWNKFKNIADNASLR